MFTSQLSVQCVEMINYAQKKLNERNTEEGIK